MPFKPPLTPHPPRVVRHDAQPKKVAAPLTTTTGPPPSPEITQGRPASFGPTVVPVANVSSGSSTLLPLLLGIALGLSLVVVGIALTPPWFLPRPVGVAVYERRDGLIYAGVATALSIGLGLLITLASS